MLWRCSYANEPANVLEPPTATREHDTGPVVVQEARRSVSGRGEEAPLLLPGDATGDGPRSLGSVRQCHPTTSRGGGRGHCSTTFDEPPESLIAWTS
jgi:hypothetical protein